MTVFNLFSLLGGLALFLFGMDIMGKALEKQAGGQLQKILSKLTDNPLKGFFLGLGVTAVSQSSSATTVKVVGCVNSGIMELHQAIGIIMGSNVGTTVTSWILSLSGLQGDGFWITMLKPTSFSPILAFIGILLYMGKNEKRKGIGTGKNGAATMLGIQAAFAARGLAAAAYALCGSARHGSGSIIFYAAVCMAAAALPIIKRGTAIFIGAGAAFAVFIIAALLKYASNIMLIL